MDTAALTKEEPVYAIEPPKRRRYMSGEVWFEVPLSNGHVMAHETLGSAMRFYRENRRQS